MNNNQRHRRISPWVLLRRMRHAKRGILRDYLPVIQRKLAHDIGTLLFGWTHVEVVNPEVLRWCMEPGKGVLMLTWHGRTLVPLNFFRDRGVYALISYSRDGDLQNAIFRRFGWNTVRGSTGQQGASAARVLTRVLRRGDKVGLTPDGPRGPREIVQPGAAIIQRLAHCPIVAVGVGIDRHFTLSTWDRYQLPKPLSRAVLYFDDPLLPEHVRNLDIDSCRRLIEERLFAANRKAEEVALHMSHIRTSFDSFPAEPSHLV